MNLPGLRVDVVPTLDRPLLIAAFKGWNDGGQGATLAAGYLARLWRAQRFADIDPEEFVDFQTSRPHVALDEGATRRITWPENAFHHARIDALGRDAVILLGIEPNYRWRHFTELIVGVARELEIELVVTFGALLADVPHTRPAPVTGAATDPDLVEELGLQLSRYEGPTGIVGVLLDACRQAEIPAVSLWSAVPHYVSLAPSPRAAKALCERLGALLRCEIDLSELEAAEATYAEQINQAVEADEDTASYVEELERRADSLGELSDEGRLPSGDTIADELTRFLRERERRGEQDPPAEQ
jgi:proteasome assembly chaperone (PAC2) family protein